VLGRLHQPRSAEYVDDVLIVIEYESGGDPRARNDFDVNAQNGDPSRGLMQTIGATFSAFRDPALPNDIFDPVANIYAGLAYGIARYGSIPNIPGVKSVNSGGKYRPYAAVRAPGRG
jgi:SLT domain-containing protein